MFGNIAGAFDIIDQMLPLHRAEYFFEANAIPS